MSLNRPERWLISSPPPPQRHPDGVVAGSDLVGRIGEREDGTRDLAREPPAESESEERADCKCGGEAPHERQPLIAQLGAGLGDDDRAERIAVGLEAHRCRRGEVGPAAARRCELERLRPFQRRHLRRHQRLPATAATPSPAPERATRRSRRCGRRLRARAWTPRNRSSPSPRRRHARQRPRRAARCPDASRRSSCDRLAPRVRLEQPQRDDGGNETRQHDAEEEQGRQAETQRPEHTRSVGTRRRAARRRHAGRSRESGRRGVRSCATL